MQCQPDPPAGELPSEASSQSVDCPDEDTQYQPEDGQYQDQRWETCESSDDAVAPTDSEPIPPSTPSSSDASPAPAQVTQPLPTSAPVKAPGTEQTPEHSGAAPAPNEVPATTKPTLARGRARPERSRFRPLSSSKKRATSAAQTASRLQLASARVQAKPRPTHTPNAKPRARVRRRNIEVLALPSREPASAHVDLFGDWFPLSLALPFVFTLGLLLLAVAATATRSVRSRLKSTALSDQRGGVDRTGIRYRD